VSNSNLPLGASNDSNAPYNQPDEQYDYQLRDMAVEDLETVLERVKQSNGIFPDKFHRLLDELLTINFE